MKVLESFLISLGLKVDKKSFEAGENAFSGITKSALQLGAVLASKLAIDKVVGDFKNVGTQLDNFHKLTGMSTQNVQMFGQALAAMGGSAADAFGTFQKVQDLMKSPMTGKIEWAADAAKYGFDPDVILKAKSTEEALANIAGEMEKLPLLQKRLAGQAMGFSDDEINVLIKGRAELEKQFDIRGKLGVMTGKQIDDAARLTKANSELNLAFTDMGNTIAGELTPAFAEMAEDFVNFYRGNKDLVDSGLKEFFGGVAENIQLVAAAMALLAGASALKGLAALRSLLRLGGARPPVPPVPGPVPPAATGIPLIARLGVPAAALFYSSKLNDGEDQELMKNRMRQGGSQAAGPVIDYLRSKGISEVLATGIAANIQKESSFNAKAVGDGGQAYGLLQWHKPRQDDFARYLGKDIKQSTETEQLDFLVHEITKGKEKAHFEKVKLSQTAYEAGSSFSREVVRPGVEEEVKSLRAKERGELADSYARSRSGAPASTAPEVTQEQLDNILGRASISDHAKAWLESYRKPPREHTANSVVQPTAQESASIPGNGSTAAQPSYIDRRTYKINGADIGKVRQILNESMSQMTEQTMQDFKSPEK